MRCSAPPAAASCPRWSRWVDGAGCVNGLKLRFVVVQRLACSSLMPALEQVGRESGDCRSGVLWCVVGSGAPGCVRATWLGRHSRHSAAACQPLEWQRRAKQALQYGRVVLTVALHGTHMPCHRCGRPSAALGGCAAQRWSRCVDGRAAMFAGLERLEVLLLCGKADGALPCRTVR